MWLIRNGIPYDVAWEMDEVDLLAHVVGFSEIENGPWDWDTMAPELLKRNEL